MDSERLARYLAGEASAPERAAIDAWAHADATNAAELSRLRTAWDPAHSSPDWNIDAAWRKVETRLREPAVTVTPIRRRSPLPWIAAAALVLLSLGVGRWWMTRNEVTLYLTGIG